MVASHAPLLGTWPATQACVLTGNRTSDPLVHKRVLNPLSHTSQGYFLSYFKRKSYFTIIRILNIFIQYILIYRIRIIKIQGALFNRSTFKVVSNDVLCRSAN